MKPVFALMVTYRRLDCFKKTVESLVATLPTGSKLVIVDNNTEGEEVFEFVQFIKSGTSFDIELVILNKNVGWGKAMNEGMSVHPEWKNYEFFLESNNDVIYKPDWALDGQILLNKYPRIGILGLWAHPHHAVKLNFTDMVVKEDMPAVAWLMRSKDLATFLPFPEKGATRTTGGNGEDCEFTTKVSRMGFWIAAPLPDLAEHMDGYNLLNLGKDNPAYV